MQGSAQCCPSVRAIPGRSDAEKALAAAHRDGRQSFYYAAIHPVREAPALIERGDWKGADDAVLASFLDLAGRVSPEDRIYRWSGTSLLVVTERTEPLCRLGFLAVKNAPTLDALHRSLDLLVAASL